MSAQQIAEQSALKNYQIVIRPHADIRNPPPALVAALAEQFEFAAHLAEGRMCVTVPHATTGDDTRAAVETVLHAAAAHREASLLTPVRVEVTDAQYTGDGYCHVLVRCETAPVRRTQA